MKERSKRLLICDDSSTFRMAVSKIMSLSGTYEIIGSARNGKEAVELARILRPDVVIMDVEMPEMNGIDASIWIKNELPETAVVMFSSTNDDSTVFKSLASGVDGYCLKSLAKRLPEIIKESISKQASLHDSLASRCRTLAI